MDLNIAHRTALVLGGGGGLGGNVAERLAEEGASVTIADIDPARLEATVARVRAHGVRCMSLQWDLGALDVVDEHVSRIEQELGDVEILVNITGGPPPTPVANQDPRLWERSFREMVLSVIAITDRVIPGMRERKWGRILTSTSSGVIAPIENLGLSNSLRSSLLGWSKTLASELGPDGITVNVLVPGRIATARTLQLDQAKAARSGSTIEAVREASMASIPLRRYGEPSEFADVVAFLCSDRAAYITGSIVRVDGGLIASV